VVTRTASHFGSSHDAWREGIIRSRTSPMRTHTCATTEREAVRVVAHGEKWCRPQAVGKKSTPVAPESGPSVFEKRFWLFVCGVVFLWISVRVFDFTLLPPAYHGLVLTQSFCGLHSWDLADRGMGSSLHYSLFVWR
jgi:hypothetical protein